VKPTFDAQGQAVLNLEFCLTVCKKSKGFRRSRPDLTFCKSPYRAFLGLSPARSLSAAFERRLERSCQRPVCSTCNIHFLLLAYGTSVPPSRVHRTGRNQGVVGHRRRCRQQGSGCSGRTGCPFWSFFHRYGSQFASATRADCVLRDVGARPADDGVS
jgi:hypothetical protein